jgi:hypothetical protein
MAEIPDEAPGPADPGRPPAIADSGTEQPAVMGAEEGRSGQIGPEDTDTGREGVHPDPDEYADPATQGAHDAEGGGR